MKIKKVLTRVWEIFIYILASVSIIPFVAYVLTLGLIRVLLGNEHGFDTVWLVFHCTVSVICLYRGLPAVWADSEE